MKHLTRSLAIAATCLCLVSAALAQINEHNNGPDELLKNRRPDGQAQPAQRYNEAHRPGPRADERYSHRNDRSDNWRPGDYRDGRQNDRRDNFNARGPEFRHGGYIPYAFRQRQYVVIDYRSHYLTPPPRGYQWAQVGPDYVLFAIATGLILQIVLSN